MTDVLLRYCPGCGEEYQPHMTTCVECGSALQDTPPEPEQTPEASLPPGDYKKVAHGLSPATAARLVGRLRAAKVPVKVDAAGHGLSLSARAEELPAVLALLERQGILPPQSDAPAVTPDGGACPACGSEVRPGLSECPECGLHLGADAACEACGAELSATDTRCPACGLPPE